MAKEGNYWQRRLTRRGVLRGAALGGAGLTAAAVIGCGDDDEEPAATPAAGTAQPAASAAAAASATPAAAQPKRGGTIVHAGGEAGAGDTRGRGFDPHTQASIGGRTFRLFYQALLGYNARTYEVKPELAQKWEQPSSTEYIFTLQPGVKWHNKPPVNGRELTVEDIVLSLERARTNEPRFLTRSVLNPVDKIEATDNKTLRITTKQPTVSALTGLSSDQLLILAKEVLTQFDKLPSAEQAIGTGAFLLQSHQDKVAARYVRNSGYWKPDRPYLDEIRTPYFQDSQIAWSAFLSGELDIALAPGKEVQNYIAKQGQGYKPDWFNADSTIIFMPNAKAEPFNDVRVRKAVRLLIDHQDFIKTWSAVWDGDGRNGSVLCAALEGWDFTHDEYANTFLEWKQPKDDAVKEALSLLNAAGFSKENPLKFELATGSNPLLTTAIELIDGQWRNLGQGVVQAGLKIHDEAVFGSVRSNRQFTYIALGFSAGIVDPDSYLSQGIQTGGGQNYGDFSDSNIDQVIDKQRVTFDIQERKRLVKDVIRRSTDQASFVAPVYRLALNAIKPKVKNYAPEFWVNGLQYEDIWLDA